MSSITFPHLLATTYLRQDGLLCVLPSVPKRTSPLHSHVQICLTPPAGGCRKCHSSAANEDGYDILWYWLGTPSQRTCQSCDHSYSFCCTNRVGLLQVFLQVSHECSKPYLLPTQHFPVAIHAWLRRLATTWILVSICQVCGSPLQYQQAEMVNQIPESADGSLCAGTPILHLSLCQRIFALPIPHVGSLPNLGNLFFDRISTSAKSSTNCEHFTHRKTCSTHALLRGLETPHFTMRQSRQNKTQSRELTRKPILINVLDLFVGGSYFFSGENNLQET